MKINTFTECSFVYLPDLTDLWSLVTKKNGKLPLEVVQKIPFCHPLSSIAPPFSVVLSQGIVMVVVVVEVAGTV